MNVCPGSNAYNVLHSQPGCCPSYVQVLRIDAIPSKSLEGIKVRRRAKPWCCANLLPVDAVGPLHESVLW